MLRSKIFVFFFECLATKFFLRGEKSSLNRCRPLLRCHLHPHCQPFPFDINFTPPEKIQEVEIDTTDEERVLFLFVSGLRFLN